LIRSPECSEKGPAEIFRSDPSVSKAIREKGQGSPDIGADLGGSEGTLVHRVVGLERHMMKLRLDDRLGRDLPRDFSIF
jgi:hypothetical protein